jgi:CheY-like chemotaxis protein
MEGRIKIVVADDSSLARDLIAQALKGLDLELFQADGGNAAIRMINEQKPDLVVLDISMPYPDGMTVLRKIRQDKEFHTLPVIICSVEKGPSEIAEAKRLRANGYFQKPFELKSMRSAVLEILEKRQKKRKSRRISES